MVIGIHTYADGAAHMNLFFRQFLNCAVPIFLAISGFFIGKKSFQERGSYTSFLKKQVPRVYIPMVLWSIPWALQAIHMGTAPIAAATYSLIGKFSVFYFIILIIQFYILTPLIQKLNYKHGGGYSVVITLIGISLFDYFLRIRGVNVGLLASGGPFPVWMAFYVLGVLKAQGLKIPFQTSKPLLAAFIALILCCVHIAAFHAYNGCVVHGIKLTAHLYSYFIVMWLLSDSARATISSTLPQWATNFFATTGRLSFLIYLNHCIFIIAVAHLNLPSVWALRWALSAAVSIAFALCCDKLCPKAMRRYIGL